MAPLFTFIALALVSAQLLAGGGVATGDVGSNGTIASASTLDVNNIATLSSTATDLGGSSTITSDTTTSISNKGASLSCLSTDNSGSTGSTISTSTLSIVSEDAALNNFVTGKHEATGSTRATSTPFDNKKTSPTHALLATGFKPEDKGYLVLVGSDGVASTTVRFNDPTDPYPTFYEPYQPYGKTEQEWYEAGWVLVATYIFIAYNSISALLFAFLISRGYLDWHLNLHLPGDEPQQGHNNVDNNSGGGNRAARRRQNRANRNGLGAGTGYTNGALVNANGTRPRLNAHGRPGNLYTNDPYELDNLNSNGLRQDRDALRAVAARPPVFQSERAMVSAETLMGGNREFEVEEVEVVDPRVTEQRRWEHERDLERVRRQFLLDDTMRRAGIM